MNWKHILHFVIEEYSKNLKLIFFDLIMLCSSFLLLCYVSLTGDGITYSKQSVSKHLNGEIDKTGELLFNYYISEQPLKDYQYILEEIADLKEVKAIGEQSAGWTLYKDGLEELCAIQQQYTTDDKSDGLRVFTLSDTLLDLCKVKIEESITGKGTADYELILGSNFSNIPLGTMYTQTKGNGTCTYEVVGRLAENSYWLDPDIYYVIDTTTIDAYICLNNLVLLIDKTGVGSTRWTFLLEDDASLDTFKQKIRDIEAKYNVSFEITTLETILSERTQADQQYTKYMRRFFPVLVFSVIVMTLCIQITEILKRKRQFGVYFSCGISIGEIRKIWMLTYFVKLLISYCLACFFCIYIIKHSQLTGEMIKQEMTVFSHYTAPKMGLLAIFLYLLIMIVPAHMISKMKPAELIKSE